jgi:hypothetical protein
MSALKNQKHELFCQLAVRGAKYGWSQADIYLRSGYRADGHAAEVAASRLMKKAEIRARLSQLAAPGVKRALITVESLLAELEANVVSATVSKQHGAMNGALTLMAKLRGLLIERVEVGEAGAFAACETVDECTTLLLQDMSPQEALALLDQMRHEIEKHAAGQAIAVEQTRDTVDRTALATVRRRPH